VEAIAIHAASPSAGLPPLSSQPLPTLDRNQYAPAAGVARGAYVLVDAHASRLSWHRRFAESVTLAGRVIGMQTFFGFGAANGCRRSSDTPECRDDGKGTCAARTTQNPT
jgi:hypothetical protein